MSADIINMPTGDIYEEVSELLQNLRSGEADTVIIVWRMNDGEVRNIIISEDELITLGLLRFTEMEIYASMDDEEE